MSVSITSTMNKCINFGTSQCNPTPIQYNKNVTSFNNPSISKSVRLSEYISTNRYKKVIQNQNAFLDNRGLTFTPVHKVTVVQGNTDIIDDTYIKFPWEKIYITCIQRNLS